MGGLRPLKPVLRWRTRRGRATATHRLDLLAIAVQAKGYRAVKLYHAEELPARPVVLWVFALGPHHHVRVAVGVRTASGGRWAYNGAGRDAHLFTAPCGDAETAAERVDAVMKHRMFPSTW